MSVELTAADTAEVFARRDRPIAGLAADAPALAAACHAMAGRFHRGGRLLALGTGAAAADAAHVVVEFVHPVIVGKRALPALSLPGGPAGFRGELDLFGEPDDIAFAIAHGGVDPGIAETLAAARQRGMLTVALLGADRSGVPELDHVIAVASDDPRVVREGHVTTYHVLWELVHVFLDAPEVL
jgi:D-sedoheptulose 7-phosphate isomerase